MRCCSLLGLSKSLAFVRALAPLCRGYLWGASLLRPPLYKADESLTLYPWISLLLSASLKHKASVASLQQKGA